MGRLIFGMIQSLDGYIAGPSGGPDSDGVLSAQAAAEMPPPGPIAFRHFADHIRSLDGIVYGRRMYEVMRYWDQDRPDWEEIEHDFARAWRPKPKWVASRSLKSVGANATLVQGDVVDFVRNLKSRQEGDIEVAGPEIANVLSAAGLIDEYRLYLRPYVFGGGKPYFAGPVPPLRLVKHDAVGEDVIRLTYVPA
jgi:dihydrofolate reductase